MSAKSFPNTETWMPLLEHALVEDIGQGDVTSNLLLPEDAQATLQFRNRESLVVAGMALVDVVYKKVSEQSNVELLVEDGDPLEAGAVMAVVSGNARALLTAERVALNLLQRCCGVATLTRQYVDAVAGTNVEIRDTRKTMPGFRSLDKYAVTCGGGVNHRMRLDDMILIKDNHIAIAGGVVQAIEQAQKGNVHGLPIEVECDTLEQAELALKTGVEWVLLDNMPPSMLQQAVAMANGSSTRLEASGGVIMDTVRKIAETGVDAISIGALTHSARAVDIGLDIELVA